MNAPFSPFKALDDVVSSVYSQFDNMDDAIAHATEIIESDKALLRQCLRPIVTRAMESMLMQRRHQERLNITRGGKPFNPSVVSTSKANTKAATAYWWEYRLSTHKRLGDATLEDLEAERLMYAALAEGNARKERFFSAIHEHMKSRKKRTVQECLDQIDLDGLAAKAGLKG